MFSKPPTEVFPTIGTVENPAIFFDGENVFFSYEIAPIDDDGIAILLFEGVIDFRINPITSEGLQQLGYPAQPWAFTEVYDADKNIEWATLKPRFWTISFNDLTVEILFGTVTKVFETKDQIPPNAALQSFLKS